MSLKAHPLADAFPSMEGEAFDRLVEDIRLNGLLDRISLYRDQIIDGRNRYRACQQIGMPLDDSHFERLDNRMDEAALLRFVVAKNFNRRHLDESQRAMVAARLLRRGIPLPIAAAQMNVSTSSIREAARIAGANRPGLVSLIDRGVTTIHRARRFLAGDIPASELGGEPAGDPPPPPHIGRPKGSRWVNATLNVLARVEPLADHIEDIVGQWPADPAQIERLAAAHRVLGKIVAGVRRLEVQEGTNDPQRARA